MGRGTAKRKREVTLNEANGSTSRLPPAPSNNDASAIPKKLRRMMQLKQSSSDSKSLGRGDQSKRKMSPPAPSIHAISGKSMRNRRQGSSRAGPGDSSTSKASDQPGDTDKPAKKKRKRKEESLLLLSEKFKAVPPRQGLQLKRKRYLQEKKKKKKGKGHQNQNDDLDLPLNEHEKILFGDVVEAPPKLSFPAKAKQKVEAASQERVRLQAIDAYRTKRKWDFRSVESPPSRTEADQVQ